MVGVLRHAHGLAPAKINVHLAVGPRRSDGYHSLRSIFQLIDLADEISITLGESETLSVEVKMVGIPPIRGNTVERAALLFAETIGLSADIRITCVKQIPMESGLGGGSSDAATVLLLLNRLCGQVLSDRDLLALGAAIGSDVPFFLGGSALSCVEGRGEVLTPMVPRDDLIGLVVMPHGFGVSTARAFADLDALRATEGMEKRDLKKSEMISMYGDMPSTWRYFNDFRQVMGPLAPFYDRLDAVTEEFSGCFGTLSGSGATYCVVGVDSDEIGWLRTKLENMAAIMTIRDIKCLHRGHSGDTVLV